MNGAYVIPVYLGLDTALKHQEVGVSQGFHILPLGQRAFDPPNPQEQSQMFH